MAKAKYHQTRSPHPALLPLEKELSFKLHQSSVISILCRPTRDAQAAKVHNTGTRTPCDLFFYFLFLRTFSAIAPALLYLLHPCSRPNMPLRPCERNSCFCFYSFLAALADNRSCVICIQAIHGRDKNYKAVGRYLFHTVSAFPPSMAVTT
jgi:hypothetical protein